ncbi:MAG: 2OG-Fe(II) oxygenase [Neomegalonema sp.]|nr:2OG-Fe(II) oxygenase [Neomegalonema sp.]
MSLSSSDLSARIAGLSQDALAKTLDDFGAAMVRELLPHDACANLAALYPQEAPFRSHIHMARHGFGRGEYKYFAYPLPDLIETLRVALYSKLAPIANEWSERMSGAAPFPARHADYIAACHAAGQRRPTPLLLQYVAGDYNCLHQDVYGELLFPLQVAILLSRPPIDFMGGEFVMTEQRPRMQSRAQVVALNQGDAVIFPVRERPVRGAKRDYRVTMRHGVSRVTFGRRHTLGIIFHDAT